MRIAAASLNQTPLDWQNNLNNIIACLQDARSQNVNLLCLPELCITGYGCEDMFLHPWVADKSLEIVEKILPETAGIAVTVGLPMHYAGKTYNAAALLEDGKILGFQAKQHLPKDGIHYEPRWFEPWNPGEIVEYRLNDKSYPFGDGIYEIKEKKVGFEICEDAWVADRPACRLVEFGVDIILNPSASHFALLKSEIRKNKAINASKEFNCTYVFANQLGNEAGRIIYDGDSVIAHKGKMVANTPLFSFKSYELTTTEIDFTADQALSTNITEVVSTKNEQFAAALSLGLFDYLRKSRSKGYVLSLSGGADSSTCLILLAEMSKRGLSQLGIDEFRNKTGLPLKDATDYRQVMNELVTTAYQGTDHSSAETFLSAQKLAESVGAVFYNWSIQPTFESSRVIIETALGRKLTWEDDDITLQNIQARSRSPLIWMVANITGKLLLSTSNRSEGAVGYATMDGDTSGSISPIAGIDKPFILQWLKWAETELDYPALSYVNSLTPTAELRPLDQNQSDEEDLMPYEILNRIEGLYAVERLSPVAIYEKLQGEVNNQDLAAYIIRFFSLWTRNQWKRERLAPSFHIDDRNLDPRSWFRFPILSGSFQDELNELRAKAKK